MRKTVLILLLFIYNISSFAQEEPTIELSRKQILRHKIKSMEIWQKESNKYDPPFEITDSTKSDTITSYNIFKNDMCQKSLHLYDLKGNEYLETGILYDGDGRIIDYYQYYDTMLIRMNLVEYFADNVSTSCIEKKYDSNGRIKYRIVIEDNKSDTVKFYYNDKNQCIKMVRLEEQDSDHIKGGWPRILEISTIRYSYNQNSKIELVMDVGRNPDHPIFFSKYITHYYYDLLGNCVKMNSYNSSDTSSDHIDTSLAKIISITYYYNKKGKPLIKVTSDNNLTKTEKYKYKYGKLMYYEYSSDISKNRKNSWRLYYTRGDLIKRVDFYGSNNYKKTWIVNYEYY